jgi:hypothetical protein
MPCPKKRHTYGSRPGLWIEDVLAVGCGHDFDVREGCLRSLVEFVVDAGVRNLNLVVHMWKFESFSDLLLDLGEVPFRLSYAGAVEGFLDFVCFSSKSSSTRRFLPPPACSIRPASLR